MSLAEAMSAEKPVVATRVGGMVNVVDDGKTGIIVEPGDENDLAQAISHLIENPELREQMGKDGRNRILKLFTWEQVAQSLEKQYRRVL
jgi:glycosyltransferase involved in cell wall biosynthesis